MATTIDAAGRIVIPKAMREQIGLVPGPVNVHVEGARVVIEPLTHDGFVQEGSLWVIPASGERVTDEMVRALLDEGRR
jgi:AbrB family looped-hinge helix DNA binding protein